MNKINAVTLIVFVLAISACYQKGSTNTVKPIQTSGTSAPVAEKSVEPGNQMTTGDSGGDYSTALNYLKAKDYEKAASEFQSVVRKDSKNQLAYLNLARSYQGLKKSDQAVSAYKTAIELRADDAEANYELGKIYLDKKDYAASLPFIEKAAKIKYTSTDYLITLGDNYRELKKCDYAVVPYGKVMGFDDKNTAAYYGMGLCYITLKNRIAAGQQVRNLEKLDKNLAKKLEDQIPK